MGLSRTPTKHEGDITMSEMVALNHEKVNLKDISHKDKAWDKHKKKADIVSKLYFIYSDNPRDDRRAEKIRDCAGFLRFGRDDTGTLNLIEARFCHKRACPVCQWRRSLMMKAKFYLNLPDILLKYPNARFIFLTLTVKNCELKDLRTTIQKMNKNFTYLMKQEYFKKVVIGYVKNVEVTKSENGTAHPHFHVLLAVIPSYFSGEYYKSQIKWRELWKEQMKLDYLPQVDVRIPKANDDTHNYIQELLKYPVKESDIDVRSKWFISYCEQVHHLRFISTGGIFKGIIKEVPVSDDELINTNPDEGKKAIEIMDFVWNRIDKHYQRKF